MKAFIELPYRLNREDPAWRPPLRLLERDKFDPKKNPGLAHLEVAFWLAKRGDTIVGRCASIINKFHLEKYQDSQGHFGFLDTDKAHPGAQPALLKAAEEWLRTRGMTEIARLVDAINDGFSRAEEAQSRSKLLISGAAHALRSPIQALLSQAQSTLRKERSVDRYRDTLEGQEHELTEFARSVDNLVALCAAGDHAHASEAFDLMGELRLRLQPDEDRAKRGGVELSVEGPDSLLVEAERESVVLAVRNLISNALSVSASGQRVELRVEHVDGRVEVSVDDAGPGVPSEDRDRVFEAMRRGSNAGRSGDSRARYGLGLALVRRAMDDHRGRAWIEDSASGGARVRLSFPAVAPVPTGSEQEP
ncbi:MAG: HAMP domain-containing sensor histidine kinase [Planctomycetota bacterium]